jgi:hypothetical protein
VSSLSRNLSLNIVKAVEDVDATCTGGTSGVVRHVTSASLKPSVSTRYVSLVCVSRANAGSKPSGLGLEEGRLSLSGSVAVDELVLAFFVRRADVTAMSPGVEIRRLRVLVVLDGISETRPLANC